ncbi:Lipoprotein-releasing system ATP-binding protein LolD [Pseudomonas putida]|uniref:ABC transporter ATP-binding protein n=1 Tax=Pseudomonas TaxID=286 RepID=UPI0008A217D3|nr:ABC transporter ATP-binding protein [Pseudomonas sp. HMSC08G10]CAB5519476.1 Lipoprotein-releasing system ATP-binding protein LolD [Pseudomonas putida]OFS75070.1 ABC transporter ATP-binding protein [Pseudomonas sp. HMSC08G10]CAB5521082.1 Lipoprotein-releasing system ATP-binding protein LolD [Pseudomonas putida]CAB5551498.1 Lipoprotein-releasing system ATP-binding protein LolD [Pseudomonas putida]CAB5551632.1 Lipoprotein-releasing system ATP-binding protein LolD [Pseudomonas putida]
MLEIKGMSVVRGDGPQSHRVHLDELHLRPGEVRAITGESGCGKSTLLEAIGLLLKPERLTHYRLGPQREDVARLLAEDREPALAALRSRALGFVLQNGGLLPFLSVRENILLPRRLLGLAAHSAAVDKAIAALRLEPLLGKLPQALSIGERQRVACVRAIAHEPRVLLADEPTAALDPHNAQRLFELLLNLVAELGIAALVVSHDWALVERFGLKRLGAINGEGETRFEPMA